MNTQNIKVGDVFKNYKELCIALGTEPKDGSSKPKQLKEIETLLKFHKDGWKHIIDEIYEKPKYYENSHNKYVAYARSIFLQYLLFDSPTPGTLDKNPNGIMKIIGLKTGNTQTCRKSSSIYKSMIKSLLSKDLITIADNKIIFTNKYQIEQLSIEKIQELKQKLTEEYERWFTKSDNQDH